MLKAKGRKNASFALIRNHETRERLDVKYLKEKLVATSS